MNKITRKNRRQKGGMEHNPETTRQNEKYKTPIITHDTDIHKLVQDASKDDKDDTEYYKQPTTTTQEKENKGWFSNPFKNIFRSTSSEPAVGGNKKHPNPAFGGYLKGGKSKRRTTKQHTKKRTGGNKCNCGCKNCRCSSKNCKCKCADKRFKCICKSSACGRKRTLKHRKH